MNTNSSVIALVLGAVAVVAAAAACEGQPPLTAEGAAGAGALAPPPPEESAAAAPDETPAAAPTCCQCQCAGGQTVASAGDGGAPVAVAGDGGAVDGAVATAPPKPTEGNIVGDVVTTPAYLRSLTVVFLTDAPKVPGRGMTAHIDNRGMAFHPIVTAVTQGGRVGFYNADPFPHNVFSPDNERFDLGLVQPGHSITHQFNRAGEYTLLCNLHPNMLGYLVVSPSSFFAKTDARGHFVIKDVPLGKYSITAWAPRLQSATQSVSLTGAEAKVDFELHR